MKAISYIFTILAAVMLLAACKKAEKLMYQEDPRVYFSKYVVNPDSVIYSFAVQPAGKITDTVYLTLRIMGTAVDRDREINLQVADSSKAKKGYHYNLGPLVMPAKAYETKIPVYLYRKAGLKDSLLTIDFTVGESKDFKPGYNDIPSSNVKKTRLVYKVSLNDYLLKPTSWNCCIQSYLGDYSETKYRFVILATGKTNWEAALDTTPGIMNFVTQTAKSALYDYEQANGPMIDEKGNRVQFP